jgi:hypothetical protein
MALEKIGAYYQCHSNRTALDFVLKNYRRHYPDSTLVMVCDGGDDFSREAATYNSVYIHDRKINTESNLVFRDLDSLKRFVERLADNIHHITEDYFMMLEDDVYVMKRVTTEMLWDINGCNINEFFSDGTSALIQKYNPFVPSRPFYGCFGGSILKTEFFKRVLQDKLVTNSFITQYHAKSIPTDLASDKILSFLCLVNGGKIGHYDSICETWYPDINNRLERGQVEVLHKYKKHYR